MYGESGVSPSIIHVLHFWDIQGNEMEVQSGVTQSIINELRSLDSQGDQMEGEKKVLLEVSSMNLIPILGITKEIKQKVKMISREIPLMNFILGMSNGIKGNAEVV